MIVSSLAEVRDHVALTYAAYEVDTLDSEAAVTVCVEREGERVVLRDSDRESETHTDERSAPATTLARIAEVVIMRLAARGTVAVHAAAVVRDGRALLLAGPSGRGKTTLALALFARGLGLLSDELAIVPAGEDIVLPYRRSAHIRPGTPELIPQLSFLSDEPQVLLGGGIRWSVTPQQLERALPGPLAAAAPLTHIVLLQPPAPAPGAARVVPVSRASTVIELARGTPAAAHDLPSVIRRLSRLLAGASCARLYAGTLEETIDSLIVWLDGS